MTLSKARFIFLWPFYLQVLLVNFILRSILLGMDGTLAWSEFPGIYFWGAVHDTVFFSYLAVPLVIDLWLTPAKVFIHASNKGTVQFLNALYAFLAVGLAFFEYGFWKNNQCRFNEYAAQQLMTNKQVLVMALQNENLWILIPFALLLAALLWMLCYKLFNYYLKKQEMVYSNFRFRVLPAVFFLALPCIAFYSLEYKYQEIMPVETHWNKEQLKRNGPYQMLSLIYQKKLYQK